MLVAALGYDNGRAARANRPLPVLRPPPAPLSLKADDIGYGSIRHGIPAENQLSHFRRLLVTSDSCICELDSNPDAIQIRSDPTVRRPLQIVAFLFLRQYPVRIVLNCIGCLRLAVVSFVVEGLSRRSFA